MMNWHKIWYWWFTHICITTQFKWTEYGLISRRQWYWRALHAIQLPVCQWLDDKAQTWLDNYENKSNRE